jgi:hypothetical protein
MSILNQIPTPSFEFNAGLVDNRGALALVRQGQDITGQSTFPFVRNSVKNVPDKLGILRSVPANEPAVTFDGQGRNLGYLPESARTNLVQRSEEFDNAYWTKSNATVTANNAVAPDDTMTADRYIVTTNGSSLVFSAPIALLSNTAYTYSVFAKAGEIGQLSLSVNSTNNFIASPNASFDLLAGIQVSGSSLATILPLSGGWYRLTITGVTINSPGSERLFLSIEGDATSGLFIWGAQLEEGSFASTYIPTTSASVTRPADILTYTNASDFIGQSEGVIYAEVDLRFFSTGFRRLFSTRPEPLGLDGGQTIVTDGLNLIVGVYGNTIPLTSSSYDEGKNKFLITYRNGDVKVFHNGSLIGSDTTPYAYTTTQSNLQIGHDDGGTGSAQFLNDPISSVRLWKTTQWLTDDLAKLLTRVPS